MARTIDCVLLGAWCASSVGLGIPPFIFSAACAGSKLVDESTIGDGEQKRPKLGLAAHERRQPVEHRDEHLACEIFRFTSTAGSKKRRHGRRILDP